MYDVLSELASLSEDLQHCSMMLNRENMLRPIGSTIRILTTFNPLKGTGLLIATIIWVLLMSRQHVIAT